MQQKFIVIISGRSGSSYLRTLINQDARVLMLGEMLTRKRDSEQKAIIQDFFTNKTGNNKLIAGFKTKLNDVIDRDNFIQQIKIYNPIIIINRRKNYLRQAISRARMLVLLEQTKKKYGQGHHSPQSQADIVGQITLDVDWVWRFTTDFAARDVQLEQLSLSLPNAETIFYEDFAHCPHLAVERLSKSLNLELEVANFDTTLKNTPTDLKKAIANYDELEKKLANTKYFSFLSAP